MSLATLKLDSLPVEIIKRIASCSPCESVINLIKVNRKLCSACNDHLVFKSIIKNGNGPSFKESWNLDFISDNTSASKCARYAMADSRSRKWLANQGPLTIFGNAFGENDDINYLDNDEILSWAPQLAALHHPVLAELDLIQLIRRCDPTTRSHPQDREPMVFILALAILHQGALVMNQENTVELAADLSRAESEMESRHYPSRNFPPARFACVLSNHGRKSRLQIQPPLPLKIPFASLIDLPLPFSETYSETSHLRSMTSREFLEDGEWVGYYSYSLNLNFAGFDPPMREIRFTASRDPLFLSDGEIGLSASGIDRVGPFTLEGSIKSTGEVGMFKSYGAMGPDWLWKAIMTPFGIVGCWGERGMDQGMIWLWKREWSVK